MKSSNTPTNAEAISAFEASIGKTLPEPYKRFLQEQNGGRPFRSTYKIPRHGEAGVNFYGINLAEEYNDLYSAMCMYEGRIPSDFIPIGHDPGGNLICLQLEANHAVYFWDHEEEKDDDDPEPADMSNMYFIADGFEKFINELEDDGGEDW